MKFFILLIYESTICMASLYAIYWLFLRKETYFKFNRFFLLGTIIFAVLIPFLDFRPFVIKEGAEVLDYVIAVQENGKLLSVLPLEGTAYLEKTSKPYLQVQNFVLGLYLAGCLFVISRIFLGIFKFLQLKKDGEVTEFNGYSIVNTRKRLNPFSLFNTIILNESTIDSKTRHFIIDHELTHIRQRHTIDNLLVEILTALFWFNPFIWFIRTSLRHTHEYLADDYIKNNSSELQKYQFLLLKELGGNTSLRLSHNFYSMMKNRIKIMCKGNSNKIAKLKPLFVLPVVVILILNFACTFQKVDSPISKSSTLGEEVVAELRDICDLPGYEKTKLYGLNGDLKQNEIIVYRDLLDHRAGYVMFFPLQKRDSLHTHIFSYLKEEIYDQFYYYWKGDTAMLKLENSGTMEQLLLKWHPTDNGSQVGITDWY